MEKTQVVVIGGGATGTGVLRDLALRGIDCILLEQNDLATGTSGRFHGLLHSGARYAVKDFSSARECIQENQIIKKIAPDCIEDTGGLFIAVKGDDPNYIKSWLENCSLADISIEEVSPSDLLQTEPALTKDISRVYMVPDAAVDGFSLAAANALSARNLGARVKTYSCATGFKIEKQKVRGVYVIDRYTGQEDYIKCEFVVNATGAWAGQVAKMAGIGLNITPDKGVLVIFNHRITNKVINRLRPPGDGDIFVPHGSVTVFGTTSQTTSDPNDSEAAAEDVLRLLEEGKQLFPGLDKMRLIRAFAGVRPLYQPDGAGSGREATRDFFLIDHDRLHGLEGMISMVGGKLTTYRLMAKAASDHVSKVLKVDKPCLTDKEIIYPPIPKQKEYDNKQLCQCERVSSKLLDLAVKDKVRFTLSDVRRLTRLGMGPCQGTFCTFRAAGYYHQSRSLKAAEANKLLKEHIQERFKGSIPVLWKEQAQELELTRGIYLGLLNLERLESDNHEI